MLDKTLAGQIPHWTETMLDKTLAGQIPHWTETMLDKNPARISRKKKEKNPSWTKIFDTLCY